MKKKILLMTWYENNNYGTSLQAYSLKTVIENPQITNLEIAQDIDFNAECEILPHMPNRMKRKFHKLKKIFNLRVYKLRWKQLQDKKIYKKNIVWFKLREDKFKAFTKDNFRFAASYYIQTKEQLDSIQKNYDIFISGSDQIWNPEALDPVYLLEWVPANKKKISYASSLSIKTIPEDFIEIYKRTLSSFKKISIRDASCRKQLSEITGKDVQTVVDPVILLGADALKMHVKNIPNINYVFCYFLGNNILHRERAIKFAKHNNLLIKSVICTDSNFFADAPLEKYAEWEVDPWNFVSYISSAKLVLTDSFHATVISVLLHKNFIVFEKNSQRPEQNNRIKEFLELVGLENQWNNYSRNMEEIIIKREKWLVVDRILKNSREGSFKYLMEALR